MRMIIAALAGTSLWACAAQAQEPLRPIDGTVLEVVSEGHSSRPPDLAIVTAGVTTRGNTAAEALAQNSAAMNRVLAAVRQAGIADRDVQTSDLSIQPQYRDRIDQAALLTGYEVSNQVTVQLHDVARAGAILDALVRAGANTVSGPNLTVEKPEAALDEARASAITTARARAELYARAAGLQVERILQISEAEPTPVPAPALMARMGFVQATPVMAGTQDLSVTVTVRFLLK